MTSDLCSLVTFLKKCNQTHQSCISSISNETVQYSDLSIDNGTTSDYQVIQAFTDFSVQLLTMSPTTSRHNVSFLLSNDPSESLMAQSDLTDSQDGLPLGSVVLLSRRWSRNRGRRLLNERAVFDRPTRHQRASFETCRAVGRQASLRLGPNGDRSTRRGFL